MGWLTEWTLKLLQSSITVPTSQVQIDGIGHVILGVTIASKRQKLLTCEGNLTQRLQICGFQFIYQIQNFTSDGT